MAHEKEIFKVTPSGLYKIEMGYGDESVTHIVGKIEDEEKTYLIIDNEEGEHDSCSDVVLTKEEWVKLRDFIDKTIWKEKT